MALHTEVRRVALVGLPNSGKTVLLTSLLRHLENHSRRLTDGYGDLESFRIEQNPANGDGLKTFPYAKYRRAIAEEGVFPEKTVSETSISFVVEGKFKRHRRFHVSILDVPGERFYDIEIYRRKEYEDWCDEVDRRWELDPHPAMHSYRQLCSEGGSLRPGVVVDAYRQALAELTAAYRPSITPSTFRLSRDGKAVRGRSADEILNSAASNPCGVDMERQFAPLFATARETHPDLGEIFAANYRQYRQQVAKPLFKELLRCHRLAILVDIPYLLAAGVGVDEDQSHLMKDTLEALVPRNGRVRKIGRLANDFFWYGVSKVGGPNFRAGRVQQVAFVATKSDLVSASDVDNLDNLLLELTVPLRSHLQRIVPKRIVLAAVKSTQPSTRTSTDDSAWLYGRPQFEAASPPTRRDPRAEKLDYRVSRVPAEWPAAWEPDQYSFPPVYPDMPKARAAVPRMDNLDQLFKFIVE